jgi:radical SAM superfamily enzyme YgiQ (UPF0313 family)
MDRRGLAVRWRAYSRVDTIDAELLEWMKKTGCERVLYGAESGSPEVLKKIRKGITPEQTRRAVEMTREAGIGVLASFVLGLPGETPRTLQQTLEFAESLRVPYSLNLLTPYVGTEVRKKAEEWGIQVLSNDWRRYGQGEPLTSTPTVTPWHLSRAVGSYRKGLQKYLEDLLEKGQQGTLTEKNLETLEQNRHWAFLRRLIGEEILERHGSVLSRPGRSDASGLAKSLALPLRMTTAEVEKHLDPMVRRGDIRPKQKENGKVQWEWAGN